MMDGESLLSDFFEDCEFGESQDLAYSDDLFSIFESLEGVLEFPAPLEEAVSGAKEGGVKETMAPLVSQKSTSFEELETEIFEGSTKPNKRQKLGANLDEQHKISHITVERNRRKQMNDHLTVLRSLMPCFYVKRGDQASIIGGVVDYIKELQQVLQSLEAKKQRKLCSEVLSPRFVVSGPRPSPPVLSPRKSPLSPRVSLPASPRTPQPCSPYKPARLHQQGYLSPSMATTIEPSPPSSSSTSIIDHSNVNQLVANSKSIIAEVEVKFSGPNVLLKTTSPRIHGQATKIISALEDLALEILHVCISIIDETMLNSFTIKIGIECQLSADELAHRIQQTFC